jgi:1,4-dihydroxy-2-naphthoate octaprenyltransferase
MTFPAASLLVSALFFTLLYFSLLTILYFASISSDSLAADLLLIAIPPLVFAAQEHHKHHYMDAHRPRCQFVALDDSHTEHTAINPAVGPAAGVHHPSNSAHAIDPE